jgi:hypothetical protein
MQKFSRPGVILMATVVAIITTIVVANATQTITAPNAAFVSYSLASGANSAPITPATNRAVLVMGCCTTSPGMSQVSLLHIPSTYIRWFGLESQTPVTVTQGSSSSAGTHIVYIDVFHEVDIQVASADTIRIRNVGAGIRAGNVTLIW